MTNYNRPPTPEESMDIAMEFMKVVETLGDGPTAAADALVDYLGEDEKIGTLHTWYFAACGPIIASAALRALNKGKTTPGAFWGLVQIPGVPVTSDPHDIAFMQALTAHMNNDPAAAQDVISAHEAVHGLEGLFCLVCAAVKVTAVLMRAGAFK